MWQILGVSLRNGPNDGRQLTVVVYTPTELAARFVYLVAIIDEGTLSVFPAFEFWETAVMAIYPPTEGLGMNRGKVRRSGRGMPDKVETLEDAAVAAVVLLADQLS